MGGDGTAELILSKQRNGPTGTVQEIATHLGMIRQNVSSDLSVLREEQLLHVVGKDGKNDIWAKTPVDRTLRVSKHLRETKGLEADGKPRKAKGKAAKRR